MSSSSNPARLAGLADRVVEVIADLGESVKPRYRYGSGVIVRGRTVLTAAHVVAEAQKVSVRDPDKREYPASLDSRLVRDAGGAGPDLALVEIEDTTLDLPPLGLARVDRHSPTADPVERCHAIGYPWFAETPSPTAVRETVDAIGVVPVASKLKAGLLSVLVSVSPRPLPAEQVSLEESEWSGMSGAPVVAAGLLLGVVIEHASREGPSAITAVPLTALEHDPAHTGWGPGVADPAAWWSRLGVAGVEELKRLPAPPERATPAYRATLRGFGQTLHQRMPQLLGREKELAEIAAFATRAAGYRWLVGGAYAGKTALMFEAVMAGLPAEVDAEVDVVSYFLRRPASDADSNRFLEAVVPQLAYMCGVDPAPPAVRYEFDALWQRATERAAESGRHLLLVVDGLDEDLRPSGSPSVASLLPILVGPGAHVLAASRPYPELPDDMPAGHPLSATSPVQLDPFEGAGELAELAGQEIDRLLRGDDLLAVEVLGLLTAAAGPLSVGDLAELSNSTAASAATHALQVDRFVTERAGRTLEPVGSEPHRRYQFAHYSLLEHAQQDKYLAHPEFRDRIHRWAEQWRDRDWPTTTDATTTTPRYLLDNYLATLSDSPDRMAALVADPGWVDAAIQTVGVEHVLADLRTAANAAPTNEAVGGMLAVVRGQAHNLSTSHPLTQPGYIARQLWLQAAEIGEDTLAGQLRARLQSQPDPGPVPLWTTRRVTRNLLGQLGQHDGTVRAVAVLPDGRVVSGDQDDGRILLCDTTKPGAQPIELARDCPVEAVAVLRDERVVSGGDDGRVLLWDVTKPGAQPLEIGRHDGVTAVAALPDGRVVSGGSDRRVLLWNVTEPGGEPIELGRHDDSVTTVAELSGGRIVSGGDDGRVLLWDTAHPGAPPTDLGHHDDRVAAVAVLPDHRVVSGGNGRVLLWDTTTPGAPPMELGSYDGWVIALTVLRDGRVVSSDEDGRMLLWDKAKPGAQPIELARRDDTVGTVAEVPGGRVVSGGDDGRVLLWNAADPGAQPIGRFHDDEVTAVAALPDGRVVSGDEDGRVLLWNPADPGTPPIELGRHDGTVGAVAVLPGGRVASGGGLDGRVLLWDPAKPGIQPIELARDCRVKTVAVLGDERVVSGDEDGRVLLWNAVEAGAPPIELGRYEGLGAVVAGWQDGRVAISGGRDRRVLLWDAADPDAAPIELGRHDSPVRAVAALPGRRVVTGGNSGRVLLWNATERDAQPIKVGRHNERVLAVAALPGERLASGGHDGPVRLWDLTTRTEIAQLGCSSTALVALQSRHQGTLLVIAHAGNGLSLWSIGDGQKH